MVVSMALRNAGGNILSDVCACNLTSLGAATCADVWCTCVHVVHVSLLPSLVEQTYSELLRCTLVM